MDAVAPIYPSHCPLHLASRLHRPGRGRRKSPTPDPQGRFGSILQCCQLSLQVLLILKARYFACSSSSSTCWKGWLGWLIHQDRQRAAGFSGCMSGLPFRASGSSKVGMGQSIIIITTIMCYSWFHPSAGCTRQGRSPDSTAASAVASSWWLGITV